MTINSIPPTLISGAFTFSGNQMTAINHLDHINQIVQPTSGIPSSPATPIIEAKLNVTGSKMSTTNVCCMFLTIMLGAWLIIPFFFMCCSWWKKIVYPKYEINIEFYRAIGRFLRTCTTCVSLSLTVYDNSFDQSKARVLYQSLEGTQLTSFTFVNNAIACDYNNDEVSNFEESMRPIKSLPINSSIQWGGMKI